MSRRTPSATGCRPRRPQLVNDAHAAGHRVIAVGTTATRALETDADARRRAHAGDGWTELVITPDRGLHVVDGIISGWHEPEASHLLLMEAVAGRAAARGQLRRGLAERYRWHEFGDIHLVLPSHPLANRAGNGSQGRRGADAVDGVRAVAPHGPG